MNASDYTFDELVAQWKAYQRRDAVERFRIVANMERYLRYNTGDTRRLATAIGMDYHVLCVYLKVTRKFTAVDAEKLAEKGYGWSHLVLMAQRADTKTYKEKALSGQPARVLKAELNARPVANKSGWQAPRDLFILAVAEASPEQICNWIETYLRDGCAPPRAEAIVCGLRRITVAAPKVAA
jgi:galactokinase